jgi:DNA-binding response OmpR family regulator
LVVDDDPRYGQWLGHHLGVFCPDSTVTVLNLAGFERWCETDSGRDCDIMLLTAPFGSSPEDPKARGLELLRKLRGRPIFPAVITLAEDGNELTAVRALQLGAVDYLPKRLLTPERLSTSVRLALRRIEKRVQRKLQSLAHVDVTPADETREQKLDHASAAETWASMTLTPAIPPKSSSAKEQDAPAPVPDAPVATEKQVADASAPKTGAAGAKAAAASADISASFMGEADISPPVAETKAPAPESAVLAQATPVTPVAVAPEPVVSPPAPAATPAPVVATAPEPVAQPPAPPAAPATSVSTRAAPSSDASDTNSAATQLMAPGQLEAILNSAEAAALRAIEAAEALSKVPDTSFTGSIVASPTSKDAKSSKPTKPSGPKRPGTPAPPVTAEFIPGYIIKMKIGESEKAVVYLATSISLGANVALKVSKTLRDDTAGRQFLEREYTAIIAIRDPLVVQIYDYGVHAGFEYLAMEYLLRGDLKARMQAGLKEAEALRYVDQIAAALRVVHNAGLLHRDLKPPNVMLRDNDDVALIDFGLARALDGSTPSTRTGVLRGSPYYMSPEQAQGEQLDVRSDFYSLGIMFYEMLTGRKPYTGATAMEVLQQHVNSPLPPLPHSLTRYETLLHKLAAKNRNERFTKADEIIAAIAELRSAMALDVESAVA